MIFTIVLENQQCHRKNHLMLNRLNKDLLKASKSTQAGLKYINGISPNRKQH